MADAVLFSIAAYAPGRSLLAGNLKKQVVILPPDDHRANTRNGGLYGLSGTTVEVGPPETPVRRKVRLYNVRSGCYCAFEVWSEAADGAYAFEGIDEGPWTLVAYDHTGTYNAAVADNQTATGLYGR
jgi:hypothetical protein